MNYLWDTLIKAKKSGVPDGEIKFQLAKSYSAYMEMSFYDFNVKIEEDMERSVEINPYYRFAKIFKDFFDPDNMEDLAEREEIFDWLMHLIGTVDINIGMNRQEFFRRFVQQDIESGAFGDGVKETWFFFEPDEKEYISNKMVDLYKLNAPVHILRQVVHNVFKHSYVYVNHVDRTEILIYAGVKKIEKYERKMDFIKKMFLPLGYQVRIYWDKHFGIIENEPTMRIDSIVLY